MTARRPLAPGTFSGVDARPIALAGPEVYHLPKWRDYGDPRRLAAFRQIVMTEGRDPRVAEVAVTIIRRAGVPPRAYQQQAAALLQWVQTHIYYVNEPGERIQAPLYTIQKGYGDCDCLSVLLASLLEAVALPWRFVLSGYPTARMPKGSPPQPPARLIEGGPRPTGYRWAHIYLAVGDRPFRPERWIFAEPSARVPFGWDVVASAAATGRPSLPELEGAPQALAPAGALGSLAEAWDTVKERLELPAIVEEVKDNLRWRRLAVTVASGAVMGLLTQATIILVMRWWQHRRKATR